MEQRPNCNILANLNDEQNVYVRKLVIEMGGGTFCEMGAAVLLW